MSATLLNVDDSEPGRYARTRILTDAGFQVLEAGTGKEALRIVSEARPDIVLLDVNLPDVNGIEICQRIKENPETAAVIVLQISASQLGDTARIDALNRGADGYITEPVDPQVLIASVRALLRVRAAEEQLRRANEQLRRFTYVVAHELKEPLRAVANYSQMLQQRYSEKLDDDADVYLGFVVDGVHRINSFIADMLRYSQLTDARLEKKHVAAENILTWALMELHAAIVESGAQVTHDPLPEICADGLTLRQVFINLIGNAIKYRGAETPLIHVSARLEGSECIFSVKDNGDGIDPAYHDQIFVLFKRLHGRDKPGSGVGLAICKDIVERHGGKIWVESVPGDGSTFYFTIPHFTEC